VTFHGKAEPVSGYGSKSPADGLHQGEEGDMMSKWNCLLNKPRDGETILKANYDKLLHISGTFIATLGLARWLPKEIALTITLTFCLAKTIWNYNNDRKYKPAGDWIANIAGLFLWALWELI